MNPNSIYNPEDKFNRIRPFCILALLILILLFLIFLASQKSADRGKDSNIPRSGKTAQTPSNSGSGRGSGTDAGKESGKSFSSKNSGNKEASSKGNKGNKENKGNKGNTAVSPASSTDSSNPKQAASIPPPLPASMGKPSSPGDSAPGKNQAEASGSTFPEQQWKSTKKPTISESEIWFYATTHIKEIAKDKRDVFEFPEYGVPNTSMKKVAENLYEVKGFFKVKTHDGKEKMYRFSLKIDIASTRCHDLAIENM